MLALTVVVGVAAEQSEGCDQEGHDGSKRRQHRRRHGRPEEATGERTT